MAGRSNARSEQMKAEAWARYREQIAAHGRVELMLGQDYKGSQVPMLFRCLLHNEVHPASPLRLAEGRGLHCCKGLGSAKKHQEHAAKYASKLEALGLKVRLAEGASYQGNYTKINHLCLIHGEVHPATPANVKQGHGLICCLTGGTAKRQAELQQMADRRGISLAQLVIGEGKSAAYFSLDQVPAEWQQLPSSCAAAITAGQLYCFTGKPCAHGHFALRYCNPAQRGAPCCACRNHHARQWADDNPEQIKEKGLAYYAKNRDLIRAKMRVWHQANRERNNAVSRAWRRRFVEKHGCDPMTQKARLDPVVAEKLRVKRKLESRRWRAANPEEARTRARIGSAAWRRRNPEKVAASNVFRNRNYWDAFRELTPEEKCKTIAIYKVRDKINGGSGKPAGERLAEVDHVLPLIQGGAHHPDNLLVVTTAANRFWGGKVKACPWPRPSEWVEPAWEVQP